MFEHLISVCLGQFMKCRGKLSTTQFAYRKDLGTCDGRLYLSDTLQSSFERGLKTKIVHFDFSAAFEMVGHKGIQFTLCSVGVGGSVLSVLAELLSNRS